MKQNVGIAIICFLIVSFVPLATLTSGNPDLSRQQIIDISQTFTIANGYPNIANIDSNVPVQLVTDFEMIYPSSLQFEKGILWYGYEEYRELADIQTHSSIDDLFLFNGSSVIQLTNNDYSEKDYTIENGKVVWAGYDGHDYEIFYYDGINTTQVTDNDVEDILPQTFNDLITWTGEPAPSEQLHIYITNRVITMDLGIGNNSKIHRGNVVWEANGEIFLNNRTHTFNISNNTLEEMNPRIRDRFVTWERYDGNDIEIVLYDDGNIQQITNNSYLDKNPELDDFLVWCGYDGNDDEIFLYDQQGLSRVTNNKYEESCVKINGDLIVWQIDDGDACDIMFHDHSEKSRIFRITNNQTHDNYCPDIYNGTISWVNSNSIYVFKLNISQLMQPLEPSWTMIHIGITSVAVVSIIVLVLITWIRGRRG